MLRRRAQGLPLDRLLGRLLQRLLDRLLARLWDRPRDRLWGLLHQQPHDPRYESPHPPPNNAPDGVVHIHPSGCRRVRHWRRRCEGRHSPLAQPSAQSPAQWLVQSLECWRHAGCCRPAGPLFRPQPPAYRAQRPWRSWQRARGSVGAQSPLRWWTSNVDGCQTDSCSAYSWPGWLRVSGCRGWEVLDRPPSIV